MIRKEVKVETDEYLAYFNIRPEELSRRGVDSSQWGEHQAIQLARADANELSKAVVHRDREDRSNYDLIKAKIKARSKNPCYDGEIRRVLSGQHQTSQEVYVTPNDRLAHYLNDAETMEQIEAFLAHHGVKGMHWGIRRSPADRIARLDKRIARTSDTIKAHKKTISDLQARQKDANKNGVNSDSFKREFGNHATNLGFALTYGRTKSEALKGHKDDLQWELDNTQHALGFHQNRLARLQARKAKIAAGN